MSAADATGPVAVLRRAALLVGLLAVMAGFLGMHIIAGSHALHAQSSPPGSIQTSTAPHAAGHTGGHSSHRATGTFSQAYDGPAAAETASVLTPAAATPAAATGGGTQAPASCSCRGGCAEAPAVHVGCVPSPAGASLSAPQPGTTLVGAQPGSAARADRPSGYAYLPGTPAPGDLSISRT